MDAEVEDEIDEDDGVMEDDEEEGTEDGVDMTGIGGVWNVEPIELVCESCDHESR